jgi:hypothetical protein
MNRQGSQTCRRGPEGARSLRYYLSEVLYSKTIGITLAQMMRESRMKL